MNRDDRQLGLKCIPESELAASVGMVITRASIIKSTKSSICDIATSVQIIRQYMQSYEGYISTNMLVMAHVCPGVDLHILHWISPSMIDLTSISLHIY